MKKILFGLFICRKNMIFFAALFFSLSAFAQPGNDNCSNATNRNSNTTCNNNGYTLNNATASAGIPGVPCVVGTHYDVWFKFTATTTSHTATISNRGSNFTNPEVAIFGGATCAALSQLACGTTTVTASSLTIGTTYYIRVSNVGGSVSSNGAFDICVTHLGTPPANNECATATSLTSNTSCNNAGYTVLWATASAGIPGVPCVAGVHYDVWFSFTAVSNTHTATISNLGSGLTNPEIAIFSGPCGSLVQLACATTTVTTGGLTIGATYYIRVSNVGALVSSNGTFDICVTHLPPAAANDNCSGATVLTSTATPTCTSVTGNLRYATNAAPTGACGGATSTTTYDLWYSFVATSTTHAVTISNLGSNLTSATTYIQMLSSSTNTCGGVLTSLGCQAANVTGGRLTNTALTVGNTYFVRVYVTASPIAASTANWNFDICLQNPPVNDLCGALTVLTPGVTCVTTPGTLDLAIPTVLGAPLGCAVAGTYYDVWYRFTAAAVTQIITLSGVGAGITAPRIQIYNACGGAPFGCAAATSLTQPGLLIGTQYWVSISNFNANPSGTGGVANFNICITNIPAPPGNDNCSGAILLTSATTCNNTAGTLIGALATAGLPTCGNALSPEVWYKFVAKSAYPIITLSSVGGALAANNPLIQLFSGNCGLLTQLPGACVASPLNAVNNPGGSGLTIGATYYVRITTIGMNNPVGAGTYTFNICITDPAPLAITIIDYAKSYINITDGTTGGTINPGDELEIRATFVIRGAAVNIDSVAFYDTLKAGMGLVLKPGSISKRTNEGKVFGLFFTDSDVDADAGWRSPFGADTTIQINFGASATKASRGLAINGNTRPTFYGNYIVMATYRVIVNGSYGTKINYGGGAVSYRDPLTGFGARIDFPYDSLVVYQSVATCPNNVAQTNILGDEFNGTFGAPAVSAGSQNRGTSPNTTYSYQAFNPGGPGDYFYAVANNTSANNSINQTVPKQSAAGVRVFQVWDITGDHTGAANTAKGNKPCNPGLPISATNPCGYMLVVNAAYRTDVAFNFTVSGACPNTYYEISSWVKNVCYKCSGDSTSKNASDITGPPYYSPMIAGPAGFADSSGVMPNLAYEIDGVDYYTTGNINYRGLGIGGTQTGSDTLNDWVRKSFIYRTGLTQTGFVLTIRNNAPGGGGNDWALDDITLRTCYPNMAYSSSVSLPSCVHTSVVLRDTVRSYYSTYTEYKWQRSTNGGASWVDIAGTTASVLPALVSGMYQFIATYTVPPAFATLANNGNQYRLVVATTPANLATGCNFSDVITITITISNCIDIDDDNDGIPDYVEFNNPLALAGSPPNWSNPLYAGFIDNDADGVNDNFDYGADANNNGVPNYLDPTFTPWVDSNSDGVNDLSDKDLDGIPNQLDRDSDNDGIPDVVESYGVDTNGDGIIDNYTDTDADGFSQNVDANSTGVQGSGNGLGTPDFDFDGIPNYLDTDSDNDGIPDLVEAGGADANNNGKIDIITDTDYDGIGDNYINGSALLLTGADVGPVDGRADNWPFKNLDRDLRPNAYDVDSDGDGIVDVTEAGLPNGGLGIVSGTIGADGWSQTISGMGSLGLISTDADGKPDYLDIDSDNDGIPDNIEGQPTGSYALPTLTDGDGDGLMNPYDNVPAGFSGTGIPPYNHDGDLLPDYRDLDTDADGLGDRVEGNDFNLNGLPDDNVTLTGLDTDGDGLDDRFDVADSLAIPTIKGTSRRMGNGGTFTGDPTPGSRTMVQKTHLYQTDRDWRYAGYVLPAEILSFTGLLKSNQVPLNWIIITAKEIDRFEIERSIDNSNYAKAGTVYGTVKLNQQQSFEFTDDVTAISNNIIYYRLKVIGKAGEIKYSGVLIIRKKQTQTLFTMMPNPATNYVTVNVFAEKNIPATFILIDKIGRKVLVQNENIKSGYNNITLNLDKYSAGVYALIYETLTEKIIRQLIIVE